jgi:hypothetical protein
MGCDVFQGNLYRVHKVCFPPLCYFLRHAVKSCHLFVTFGGSDLNEVVVRVMTNIPHGLKHEFNVNNI